MPGNLQGAEPRGTVVSEGAGETTRQCHYRAPRSRRQPQDRSVLDRCSCMRRGPYCTVSSLLRSPNPHHHQQGPEQCRQRIRDPDPCRVTAVITATHSAKRCWWRGIITDQGAAFGHLWRVSAAWRVGKRPQATELANKLSSSV